MNAFSWAWSIVGMLSSRSMLAVGRTMGRPLAVNTITGGAYSILRSFMIIVQEGVQSERRAAVFYSRWSKGATSTAMHHIP